MDRVDLNAAFMEETMTPTKLHPFFKPFIDKQVDMVTEMQKKKEKRGVIPNLWGEGAMSILMSPDSSFDSTYWTDRSSTPTHDCTLTDEITATIQNLGLDSPVSVGDPSIREKLLEQKFELEKRLLRVNQLLAIPDDNSNDYSNFTGASEQFYINRINSLTRALVELGSEVTRMRNLDTELIEVANDTEQSVIVRSPPTRD